MHFVSIRMVCYQPIVCYALIICTVPVIAVFTKCDAFRRNTRIDLEDDEEKAGDDLERLTDQECQEIFQRECLDKIEDIPFVCLEGQLTRD
jgi:hypothetical protein